MGNLISFSWNSNLVSMYSRLGMYFCFSLKRKNYENVIREFVLGYVRFGGVCKLLLQRAR